MVNRCGRLLAATFLVVATAAGTAAGAEAAPGPVPTVVTAVVSANDVPVRTEVTVSGTVTGSDLEPRDVELQFATDAGWRPMRTSTTDAAGAYQMRVPTDWYGDHVLRVVAPKTATADSGASPQQTVSVHPRYDPRGSSDAWSRFSPPARWDPCRTVEYRTNLRKAPRGSAKLVKRAFDQVHAATGIPFRAAGSTRKVPFTTGPDSSQHLAAGLVIAWATPRQVPGLRGSTAGLGGSTAQRVGDGPWRYVYGGVAVDATARLSGGFGKGKTIGALLLHEIAHAIGLDHTGASSQIMYPSLQSGYRGRYEAGDLTGLHALGAEQGCLS
ncbi:matrixin family metalloprotease [Nocardioides aquiterrae]|uniref:Peptidase metallopeptidase domain-containing protein n=1 Tax=Nocardioides aquiterrae TaxID=203799 RepID=A0ABP4F0Y9_9ACTN